MMAAPSKEAMSFFLSKDPQAFVKECVSVPSSSVVIGPSNGTHPLHLMAMHGTSTKENSQ
jgi:hypothetical protein